MSSILFKAEDALRSIIINAPGLNGVSLHRGSDTEELVLPYISILAETSEERQPRAGNYEVGVKIELYTSSDDKTRDERIALTNRLIDALSEDDLVTSMSMSINDFRIFGILRGSHTQKIEERAHVYSIEMKLHCCNSDV